VLVPGQYMSRPKRACATAAAERIRGVYEWEACAESSTRFQALASSIEDHLAREQADGMSDEYESSSQEPDSSEDEGSYESSFVSKSDVESGCESEDDSGGDVISEGEGEGEAEEAEPAEEGEPAEEEAVGKEGEHVPWVPGTPCTPPVCGGPWTPLAYAEVDPDGSPHPKRRKLYSPGHFDAGTGMREQQLLSPDQLDEESARCLCEEFAP